MRRAIGCLLALVSPAWAVDVQGVLPASLDQPRIYLAVVRGNGPTPLAARPGAGGADALAALLGEKPDKNNPPAPTFAVEAFLDTGASGTLLSKTTCDALGIRPFAHAGQPMTFYDVGVAGKEAFGVTEPLRLRAAEYSGRTDGTNLGDYTPAGPAALLKIRSAGGLIEQLTGGLDVAGTPLMAGRVMLIDCRPLAQYDKLRTQLLPPNHRELPKADARVPLTFVDFDRFTQTTPAGSPKVDAAPNPLIGPSPFKKDDPAKPVVVTHRGKSAKLTMLLDTGAAASMISTAKAKELGLTFDDGGKITNAPAKETFTLPIGGIGGTADVSGCFVDTLTLPTVGQPVRYVKAPLLVKDITVVDEKTGETYTLDGVFGMNYLVASASVSGGLNAGVDDIHDGPYKFFAVDFVGKTLGLTFK